MRRRSEPQAKKKPNRNVPWPGKMAGDNYVCPVCNEEVGKNKGGAFKHLTIHGKE